MSDVEWELRQLRFDIANASLKIEKRLGAVEKQLGEFVASVTELWTVVDELDVMAVPDLRERVERLEGRRR